MGEFRSSWVGGVAPDAGWYKSSFSAQGNCVEFSVTGSGVLVRDSKDRSGPSLAFTPGEWAAFLAGVRAGEFDI